MMTQLSPADTAAAEAAGSPAVFIDKDGTLLKDVPYNVRPEAMVLETGVAEGLRLLGALGWPLVVVSNQAGVAYGRFPESQLETAVAPRLEALFAECGATLAGFRWCPHAPDRGGRPLCGCRKPQPGLLIGAAAELDIDLSRSWMLGDILDDVEAGRRAGCRTVLVDNGHETEWRPGELRVPHHRAPDFAAAAQWVAAARPVDIA
jgi:D,D-heptose 1,7-bisphosphate phosphatase